MVVSYKCLYKTWFQIHNHSVTQTRFGSYFQKGIIFPFGKESIFLLWKNHPLLEDAKFKLLLCMSLVFTASRNVSFSDNNHILKVSRKGFENLPSSIFSIPKICYQAMSCACDCIYLLPILEVSFRHSQQYGR